MRGLWWLGLSGCLGSSTPDAVPPAEPPVAPAEVPAAMPVAPDAAFLESCRTVWGTDDAWKAAAPELLPQYCACVSTWITGRYLTAKYADYTANPRHPDLADSDGWCRPPAAGGDPEEFGIGD